MILGEQLKEEADALRKQAQPIWEALECLEGYEQDKYTFESSLVHFEQQCFCITVMGEFNTGKSTLLNAFIGDDVLATDQLECTAVPTWIGWCDEEGFDENRSATVIYSNGDTDAMPLSEVSARTTLDEEAWDTIERVEVKLPIETNGQPTGLVLVDTPGLNGNEELEARSMHQLGMSHVTIVVVPVDGIGRRSDVDLIHKARSIAGRVMVVINKCDQYANIPNISDTLDRFRGELHRRVPELPRKDIYTLSAKYALEDAYGETVGELEAEQDRFVQDLRSIVADAPVAALRERPLLLLRQICASTITRIDKQNAESDGTVFSEAASTKLAEATENLQRTEANVLRLSENILSAELSILDKLLTEEESRVKRLIASFIDELDETLLEQDDLGMPLKTVRDRISESLQKPVYDRVSRMLRAFGSRLMYDLANKGSVSGPIVADLPHVVRPKVHIAPLERLADRARAEFSGYEDGISRLKRDIARTEQLSVDCKRKVEKCTKRVQTLEGLEARRKNARSNLVSLGSKPAPKIKYYTVKEYKKVKRGGFFGSIIDFFHTRHQEVSIQKSRRDYSRVNKWNQRFDVANEKVVKLDHEIEGFKTARKDLLDADREQESATQKLAELERELAESERRLKENYERYRWDGVQERRRKLKAACRTELESHFDSFHSRLKRGAQHMLEEVSHQFVAQFKVAASRKIEALSGEVKRRRAAARAEDSERTKREDVREILAEALDTFLKDDKRGEKVA